MRRLLLLALLALPAAAADGETAKPLYKPDCVLAAVAGKKGVALDASRPAPMVLYGSKIPLTRFLEAAKEQLAGFVPDRVMNMYTVKTNEIYLNDAASTYGRHGRIIDDSLAHEYAHFIQVAYDGRTMGDGSDDFLESEAVAVQTWFREQGAAALPPSCRL
jgi:hypothetical protein